MHFTHTLWLKINSTTCVDQIYTSHAHLFFWFTRAVSRPGSTHQTTHVARSFDGPPAGISAADFLTPFIAVQALLSNFPRARQEQASFSGQINLLGWVYYSQSFSSGRLIFRSFLFNSGQSSVSFVGHFGVSFSLAHCVAYYVSRLQVNCVFSCVNRVVCCVLCWVYRVVRV